MSAEEALERGGAEEADPSAPDLSSRDLRWIALELEGISGERAQKELGLSEGLVAHDLEELREALGVGEDADLEEVIRQRLEIPDEPVDLETVAAEAEAATISDERRLRLMLRLSMGELMKVAQDAEVRSERLSEMAGRVGAYDTEIIEEIEDLKRMATHLRQTSEHLLREFRDAADG